MNRLTRHPQSNTKVARLAQQNLGIVWFVALASFSAGVFYFWYYYFSGTPVGAF